jgi:hypothetical protein
VDKPLRPNKKQSALAKLVAFTVSAKNSQSDFATRHYEKQQK